MGGDWDEEDELEEVQLMTEVRPLRLPETAGLALPLSCESLM